MAMRRRCGVPGMLGAAGNDQPTVRVLLVDVAFTHPRT